MKYSIDEIKDSLIKAIKDIVETKDLFRASSGKGKQVSLKKLKSNEFIYLFCFEEIFLSKLKEINNED
jgi:hypothetical protein